MLAHVSHIVVVDDDPSLRQLVIRVSGRSQYPDQAGFKPNRTHSSYHRDRPQREVHRQIFDGDETIEYAFMGQDPDAADNRWLHEAFENQIPIIYFLGIAPGRYQAILSTFNSGWTPRR
jgi:hypothetical protein